MFTFDSKDETTLVLGVGLHIRHEGSHGPVEHGAVGQTHGLHFWQHVHDVADRGHLLDWALTKGNDSVHKDTGNRTVPLIWVLII